MILSLFPATLVMVPKIQRSTYGIPVKLFCKGKPQSGYAGKVLVRNSRRHSDCTLIRCRRRNAPPPKVGCLSGFWVSGHWLHCGRHTNRSSIREERIRGNSRSERESHCAAQQSE